jgi:hypothetical protein
MCTHSTMRSTTLITAKASDRWKRCTRRRNNQRCPHRSLVVTVQANHVLRNLHQLFQLSLELVRSRWTHCGKKSQGACPTLASRVPPLRSKRGEELSVTATSSRFLFLFCLHCLKVCGSGNQHILQQHGRAYQD